VGALLWNGWSSKRQAQASDFSSYLQLTDRFAVSWRRFIDAAENAGKNSGIEHLDFRKQFEFFEVLNLLEGACHLYIKGTLHGATRDMVSDYLREIIPRVHQDDYGKFIVENSYSGPDTFFYMRRFSKIYKIDSVPHQ
jgi:hypothetical protein